ncbi:Glycosyltransferase family 4 protein [Vibrio owensii]|uniref:glycosyltransferase family 4 protein n=1 Tax=Vibrio owensii TaxID=696485 RepID=UPI00289480E5|nr:Glycosyltransferase family 4 protein [Vibrio owensii]
MEIKIVVVDITLKGGIERVTSLIAPKLVEQGFDVQIISLFKRNIAPYYDIDTSVDIRYMTNSNYDSSSFFLSIKTFMNIFLSCLKLANTNKQNCLFISFFPNASVSLGIITYFIRNIRFIASEHSQYYAHSVLVRALRKLFYKRSKAIITLTKNDQSIFEHEIQNAKTYQIYNPVSFEIEPSACLKNRRIISIGRLESVKGYDFLIEQMVPFFNKYPNWTLDIYGDGPLKNELNAKIQSIGLEKNIYLKGFTKNIQSEIANSSFYVCSSLTEAFPMAFLEAFSRGMPIVSVDCPVGPREIIDHELNGLLLCEEIPTFTSALTLMIENDKLYNEYSLNAIDKVKKFSINSIIKEWLELLREVDGKK